MEKQCIKCGRTESRRWYKGPTCQPCYKRQYNIEHVDKRKAYQKEYDKEHVAEKKEYNKEHAEEIQEYMKNYYQEHIEEAKAYGKEYNRTHADEIAVYQKAYYQKNADKKNEYQKEYSKQNLDKINEHTKVRLKVDPLFKLCHTLRNRTKEALKNGNFTKSQHFHDYIGCTPLFCKEYLEKQFLPGMTWENHGIGKGKWSIDHIIPLSSATTVEEIYKLCHYTNLQPMWSLDNIRKGKKIIK